MDRGKVEVKDPAEPYRFVILDLLILPMMTNTEIVRDIEKVALVLRCKYLFQRRTKKFKYIGEIANRIAPRVDGRAMVSELFDSRVDPFGYPVGERAKTSPCSESSNPLSYARSNRLVFCRNSSLPPSRSNFEQCQPQLLKL
jgi:hypothetical protein